MPNPSPSAQRDIGVKRVQTATRLATLGAVAGTAVLVGFVGHAYAGKAASTTVPVGATPSTTPSTTPATVAPTTTPTTTPAASSTGGSSNVTPTTVYVAPTTTPTTVYVAPTPQPSPPQGNTGGS